MKKSEDSPITIIKGDNFFKDLSKELIAAGNFCKLLDTHNLDIPEAVHLDKMKDCLKELANGKNVLIPSYEFETFKVTPDCIPVKPAHLIIADTTFALNPKLRDLFHARVYVDISPETMRTRWYKRAEERKTPPEARDKLFNMVNEAAEIYLRPTKKFAHIIINGEASKADIQSFSWDIFNVFSVK